MWRAYRARYRDQYAELAAIKRHVRPGDTVCDIGANKGSYLYWLSRWAAGGRVVAFEPQTELAAYLERIRARLKFENVTIEAKAVHAEPGIMQLYIPGSGNSPGASLNAKINEFTSCRATAVPVVKLDDYFSAEEPISLLKIDVEGAELGVFQGAQRILRERSPLLVFESENRHFDSGSVNDIFRYLESFGYAGRFVQGRSLRPLAEFDPAIHQRQSGPEFWNAKSYYNNFVFAKPA